MSESWLDQPAFELGSLLRCLTEAEVDFVIVAVSQSSSDPDAEQPAALTDP